jgi:phosphonoacetaldehyde hydrolase
LSSDNKKIAINQTRQAFLDNGADFTIETMKDLPLLIDKINGILSKDQLVMEHK